MACGLGILLPMAKPTRTAKQLHQMLIEKIEALPAMPGR